MKNINVAMEAWERAPDGVSEDFIGKRVVKLRKVVLVMPKRTLWPLKGRLGEIHLRVVAFPRPEHVEHFRRAATCVGPFGPAQDNPGAVGTIGLINLHTGYLSLGFVQSHFHTGGNSPFPLQRSLATKYGGWRRHALREAFKLAFEQGVEIRVPNRFLLERLGLSWGKIPEPMVHREIREVAQHMGATVKISGSGWVIKPPIK